MRQPMTDRRGDSRDRRGDSRDRRGDSGDRRQPDPNRRTFRRRRRSVKLESIDYKDVDLLRQFISERSKILPRRFTRLSAKQQREVTRAIKRARNMALLPFSDH